VHDWQEQLRLGLNELGNRYTLNLPTASEATLLQLVGLLLKWNKVYNLTATNDARQLIQRHVLDSLVLCHWLQADSSQCDTEIEYDVIDVGSGAGFPLLPLAIARPQLRFLSIESNGKKTRFQQQALMELKLSNVQIRNQRVQQVQTSGAVVTSRAFTAPVDFLNIASSLCAPEKRVLVMLGKAERLPQQLPAPFELLELERVHIPGASGERHVAICRRAPAS